MRAHGSRYVLQSCALLLVSDTDLHSVTGFFCRGEPYICDSDLGIVVPFDWLKWTRRRDRTRMTKSYRRRFDYHAKQTLGYTSRVKMVQIHFCLFVKKTQ